MSSSHTCSYWECCHHYTVLLSCHLLPSTWPWSTLVHNLIVFHPHNRTEILQLHFAVRNAGHTPYMYTCMQGVSHRQSWSLVHSKSSSAPMCQPQQSCSQLSSLAPKPATTPSTLAPSYPSSSSTSPPTNNLHNLYSLRLHTHLLGYSSDSFDTRLLSPCHSVA